MPVFGKGRKNRERVQFIGKETVRAESGKRAYLKKAFYAFTKTSAFSIKNQFSPLFEKNGFIMERFMGKRKPVVVLDWGCGKARAIEKIASQYKGTINAYGFSKDSYGQWSKIKNVKLIHATKEDLLRYLKNDSVDVIYSWLGLDYLFPLEKKPAFQEGTQYIKKLLQKVSKGGKIAFNCPLFVGKQTEAALEKALEGKAEIETKAGSVYITKK